MTKADVTCLVDERGIEVLVGWHREEGGITLDSVEVVIAGRGIDILGSLSDGQYYSICEEINSDL